VSSKCDFHFSAGREHLRTSVLIRSAVEIVGAGVVELRRNGAEHRRLLVGKIELLVRALVLLAHVAQRIQRTALVELVERDEIRKVSMSIFSSCEAAPYSGVMTYMLTLE
jgi:hypothetical protein